MLLEDTNTEFTGKYNLNYFKKSLLHCMLLIHDTVLKKKDVL